MIARVRAVDAAMMSGRPEKSAVRELWVAQAHEFVERFPDDEGPVYLTLSGAEGRDIELLISRGVVATTEENTIAEEHMHRVVAVEASPPAVVQLQRRFPGLKIVEAPFQNLVRGPRPFAWPDSEEDIRLCRARVVNLDLNSPLDPADEDGQIFFPILAWVEKLGHLHVQPPRRDWCLCLTLHGEVNWNEEVSEHIERFLSENFSREPRFGNDAERVLGSELYELVNDHAAGAFSQYSRDEQQALLMVLVPKMIAFHLHPQGWRVQTEHNLRYGALEHAPMVTWVLEFSWSEDVTATPDAAYREALAGILRSAGVIDHDGNIH